VLEALRRLNMVHVRISHHRTGIHSMGTVRLTIHVGRSCTYTHVSFMDVVMC